MNNSTPPERGRLSSFIARTVLLSGLWWVLTEGATSSLVLGVPFAMLAAVFSLVISPPRRTGFRLGGALRYAWYFLTHAISGGVDVARRALSPRLPINPALFDYPTRLQGGAARLIFANTISLLPGTLIVQITDGTLTIHALDDTQQAHDDLLRLESVVADVFGQELEDHA